MANNDININVKLKEVAKQTSAEVAKINTTNQGTKAILNSFLKNLNATAERGSSIKEIKEFEKILNNIKNVIRDLSNDFKQNGRYGDLIKEKERLSANKLKKEDERRERREELTNRRKQIATSFSNKNFVYETGPHKTKRMQLKTLTGPRAEENIKYLSAAQQEEARQFLNEYQQFKKDELNISTAIKNLEIEINNFSNAIIANRKALENFKNVKDPGDENLQVYNTLTDFDIGLKNFESQEKDRNTAQRELESQLAFDQLNKLEKLDNTFGKVFKQFSIYHIALKTIKKAARDAVNTISELDISLTEQAMVTGKTREQTYGLMKEYQNLALQCGATTKEIASVATEYMKQGKTIEDSLVLTKAAVSAAKVARVSVGDSVNYLTTALNGFQLAAEDAMLVSDKFAAVAASSATDYDELAIALSKVASQANLAGMSIDYTTALLTKGLETTREAPETMGTALKTIIARMRELSDYGETLGGDTDINNVESQLAYVGIELRNTNGELRSTEDVLDDLGKKWDTLNSNQQAAIAKALAGTRQQSRLIAMMSNYERVIELQAISERSAGATLAQMSTYLEGMDAAMNNIKVAYEKIITSLSNNKVIIATLETAGTLLDMFGEFASTSAGMVAIYTVIAGLVLTTLGNKMREVALDKLRNKYAFQQQLAEKKNLQISLKKLKADKESAIAKKEQLISTLKMQLSGMKKNSIEYNKTLQEIAATEAELKLEKEQLKVSTQQLDIVNGQVASLESELNVVDRLKNSFTAWIVPMVGIAQYIKTIIQGFHQMNSARKALSATIIQSDNKETAVQQANAIKKTAAKGTEGGATIISQLGVYGIPVALAVMALFGIAVAGISNALSKRSGTGVAKDVNSLSSEVYKLNEQVQSLNSITSSYKELDNQIIKTKKDQEEMNELLSQAKDLLTAEEQEDYAALTDTQKIKFITKKQETLEQQIIQKRREAINKIKNASSSSRSAILNENATDSEILLAQSMIYSNNNATLYDYIDTFTQYTDDERKGIEELTQAMLENISVSKAFSYALNPDKVKDMADAIAELYVDTNTGRTNIGRVLTSDDYSISEKVKAYKFAVSSLDSDNAKLIQTLYSDIEVFSSFDESVVELIEDMNISTDGINNIASAIQDFGYSSEDSAFKLEELFKALDNGVDLTSAILMTFEENLNKFEQGSKEWVQAYNSILNAYSNATGVGKLNMGQNIEGLKKSVDSFYENASKWNSMSDSEKTSFLTDNAALFEGTKGIQLFNAIKTGDYQQIQKALSDVEGTFYKKVQQQRAQIITEINNEKAKLESERDLVYIQYLESELAYLEDSEKIFMASLETRLEQEEKYLEEYKSYLEDQKDALEESLNDRKEAYQKYFDAVNQEAEDEEFFEKEETLIANISKLATSNTADAINKTTTLEQELADLEKDRLKTLRERAQEKIVENIDDQIEEINQKFDTLINSQQMILTAMTSELNNPNDFIAKLITNKSAQEGLTVLGFENYVQELSSMFGGILGGEVFNNISSREENNQLILNIANKEVALSNTDQKSIYDAIIEALRQVGLN